MMTEIRWLGPYAPEERHADTVTLDHVIDLRKRLAEAERQRDNALDVVMTLRKGLVDVYYGTDEVETHKIAARALNKGEDVQRARDR